MSIYPVPAIGRTVTLLALGGIPLVKPGDDLPELLRTALSQAGIDLQDGDVLVIAQKVVSKSQGRYVRLAEVQPSARAFELARAVDKDPRLVELVLRESVEVLRHRPGVLVVEHRLGFVMANAGIDMSNVEQDKEDGTALLLPEDPDGYCRFMCNALSGDPPRSIGVIINDSHGRAWRNGTVGVAIGAAGMAALQDRRGDPDLFGRPLLVTEVALADEIAAAASMLMGAAGEGLPVVLMRGLPNTLGGGCAHDLVRPRHMDMFR